LKMLHLFVPLLLTCKYKDIITAEDALFVIDVQNDFMDMRYAIQDHHVIPDGGLAVGGTHNILSTINQLIEVFHAVKSPIFYSQDWHPADHCSFRTSQPQGTVVTVPKRSSGPEDLLPPQPMCQDEKTKEDYLGPVGVAFWPTHCIADKFGSKFDEGLTIVKGPNVHFIKKAFLKNYDSYSAWDGVHLKLDGEKEFPHLLVDGSDFVALAKKEGPARDAEQDAHKKKLEFNPLKDDTVTVEKTFGDLMAKPIKRVFVVGIATDFCVGATARAIKKKYGEEVDVIVPLAATRGAYAFVTTNMLNDFEAEGVRVIMDMADTEEAICGAISGAKGTILKAKEKLAKTNLLEALTRLLDQMPGDEGLQALSKLVNGEGKLVLEEQLDDIEKGLMDLI